MADWTVATKQVPWTASRWGTRVIKQPDGSYIYDPRYAGEGFQGMSGSADALISRYSNIQNVYGNNYVIDPNKEFQTEYKAVSNTSPGSVYLNGPDGKQYVYVPNEFAQKGAVYGNVDPKFNRPEKLQYYNPKLLDTEVFKNAYSFTLPDNLSIPENERGFRKNTYENSNKGYLFPADYYEQNIKPTEAFYTVSYTNSNGVEEKVQDPIKGVGTPNARIAGVNNIDASKPVYLISGRQEGDNRAYQTFIGAEGGGPTEKGIYIDDGGGGFLDDVFGGIGDLVGGIVDGIGDVIGDVGDTLKDMGPLPAIIGNMILPGAGSALAAVLALDEGNEKGAVLNALSAGAQMGADASTNALSAEVSGNVDLANQYSSGVQGTLASNAGNLSTASNAAQLANAIDQGNIAGALTAAGNLSGVSASPEIKTGMAAVGLAKALNSGDTAGAIALAGQLTGNQDAKVAAQAVRTLNALNSGNFNAAIAEGISLGKAADPYIKQAKEEALKNTSTASTLTGETIDPSQFDAAELLFGTNAGSLGEASDLDGLQDTGSNQLTQQDLVNIINGGIGDATLTGGTGADTLAGGQDSVAGGEATTQGGTSTDTITGGANTGTTLTGDDGSTLTIKPDGTITSTESTLTGGSGASDTITGGTTAQPNVEYYGDGTYKVTYEDGTSAIFNADGTPYSTVDNTGTNNLSIIVDDSSPSGYRDSLGQPVNQDGTPYVAPTGNDTLIGGQSTVTGGQSTVTGGQSTVPGGQSTVPGGQSTVPGGGSGGLNLGALMALLGAGQGQQAPTAPPVVDIGEQLDLEEALQTNPFAKKQTQSKMATGGSIDDLLALLQQRG